jgi:hypothetical protein
MSVETIVLEEAHNLGGGRFRVVMGTDRGPIRATLFLGEPLASPSGWTNADWTRVVSDLEDARAPGGVSKIRILQRVAYRLRSAFFLSVSDEDASATVVTGGGSAGASFLLLDDAPIPARFWGYDGAGDDEQSFSAWAGDVIDMAPFLAHALGAALLARGASSAHSAETAVRTLAEAHGMAMREESSGE